MICSPHQFALLRVTLGVYLVVYLLMLLPYATELYGATSFFVTDDRGGLVFRSLFPNLFDIPSFAIQAPLFVMALGGCALALALGWARRPLAVVLWYGLTCLVNRNPGTMNPSHAFIGWLCLAFSLVPAGEPWSRTASRPDWQMPRALYWGAWWVTAAAYTASGLDKLQSPGWVDGNAMALALDMPYARSGWMRDGLLLVPNGLQRLLTWSVLLLEVSFLPLTLFARSRRILWWATTLMHMVLLLGFRFWELSLGMLVFHMFLYDARWTGMARLSLTGRRCHGKAQVDRTDEAWGSDE